jgi:hypothetical protein
MPTISLHDRRTREMKEAFTTALLFVFCCFQIQPGLLATGSSLTLGEIVSKGVQINGVAVASGTTLLTDSLVETGENTAFIHLTAGSVLELSRDASAYFEQAGANAVRVKVHRGAMLFQEEGGEAVAVTGAPQPPGAPAKEGEPGQGLVAVLTRDVSTGGKVLDVNETSRIAATSPILIVSPDGKTKEIHYIKSVKENQIEMTAGLQLAFPIQSLLFQGDRIDPAVATGTPIVGTVAAAGGKGVSTTAVLLIVVGGGAAAGAALAFSSSGGDGGGSPPATNVNP